MEPNMSNSPLLFTTRLCGKSVLSPPTYVAHTRADGPLTLVLNLMMAMSIKAAKVVWKAPGLVG